MSVSALSSRRPGRVVRTRATRVAGAGAAASLLALVCAASALAAAPIDLGAAESYSVLATTLTSNGPTAMSDDVGTSPATALAGDTAPIVLGQTHLGDAQAATAKAALDVAYGNAVLLPSTDALPADLAGQSFGPGVYNATAAIGFTAGGVLTLTGDRNAVFVFQIGAALSVGAGARVNLEGGADACNVFWAVGGAATIGATANFAGTVMSDASVGLGASSRVDGRVMSRGPVTLSANAIRTACTQTIEVPGPAGPAGPAGATGLTGPAGPAGVGGADGERGARGLDGPQGATGATGLDGQIGATGLAGLAGDGAGWPDRRDGSRGSRGGDGAGWPDRRDGLAGLAGRRGWMARSARRVSRVSRGRRGWMARSARRVSRAVTV